MTPERARELIDHKTLIGNVWCPTSDVGNMRKLMSYEEVQHINAVWDTLPGCSTFTSALRVIAKGE